MKVKKVLATLLALCMVLGLMAGCGNNSNEEASNPPAENSQEVQQPSGGDEQQEQQPSTDGGYLGDNITVASSSDGGTFDPFASFVNWGEAAMAQLLFEGLIGLDFDYNVYYVMAKSIEQVDDTHWQVTLWDSITDINGNNITIDDVIWSYQQYIDGGNIGGIPKFVEWQKDDTYVGTMVLSEAFGDGDYEKHFGNVKVLSQKAYEQDCGGDMTTNPVGTGPYKLKDYTAGSEVVLEANEEYWALGLDIDNPFAAQNFKTITYEIIQDASARAIALKSGAVDVCDAMDSIDIDNLDLNEYRLLSLPVRAPVAIVLNANEESPLSDLNLRQGILYGIDNDMLAEGIPVPATVCYGLQPLMVDTPDSWLTGREYYDYDPAKAQELIEASSYNGETLTLMYITDSMAEAAATIIQSQLAELGVKIEQLSIDQTTANDYQYDPTKFDIRLATLGGGAYMSQTTKGWWYADGTQHYPEGSKWNFSLVPDETLDGLYEALKADNSEENINAWADYFDSMAYGYAFCYYSKQTACSINYDATVVGNSGASVVPNAMVLAG